jgi:F-type H+-transporting ATPase subunit delta
MQGSSRTSREALREALAGQSGLDAAALQRLSDDVFAVVSLFSVRASLRRALSDPGLAVGAKQRLTETLLGGKVSAPTMEILRLAAASRWSQPRDLVDSLESMAVDAALTRAERDGQLDEVEDGLFRFERILDGEPALRAALTDRNMPADLKRELLHRLLDGKTAPVTVALIERAVLFPRGRTVERVLEEFTAVAAQRRSRLIARVTSAVQLSAEQQDQLADALAREFGHEVRLQLVVDPDIIGGLTVRVGDELLDASVLRQLQAARRLIAGRPRGRAARA